MVSGYSHNLCMFYCLRHALELHHSRLLCLTHTHKEDSTVFFPLAMLSSVVALLGQKNALCSSLLSHRHALLFSLQFWKSRMWLVCRLWSPLFNPIASIQPLASRFISASCLIVSVLSSVSSIKANSGNVGQHYVLFEVIWFRVESQFNVSATLVCQKAVKSPLRGHTANIFFTFSSHVFFSLLPVSLELLFTNQ